jgi:hypothetical protein
MSSQTAQGATVTILWDDNTTLVFQFNSITAGCPSTSSFAETVKQAYRNSRTINVVYDDSITQPYTGGNATNFSLSVLYSLVG